MQIAQVLRRSQKVTGYRDSDLVWMLNTHCDSWSVVTMPTSLSLSFNGGPGLAGMRPSQFRILLEIKIMEVVVTVGEL